MALLKTDVSQKRHTGDSPQPFDPTFFSHTPFRGVEMLLVLTSISMLEKLLRGRVSFALA
jgi:hypothetical protein